jgi:hypothetical protein
MACPCSASSPIRTVVSNTPTKGKQKGVCYGSFYMTEKAALICDKLQVLSARTVADAAFEFQNNCVPEAKKKVHAATFYSELAKVIPYLYCLNEKQRALVLARMERIAGFCDCPCPATKKTTDFGEEQETACNTDPCFVIGDVMFAQTQYFALNGFYATTFAQLGITVPDTCYAYSLIQDPAEQVLHSIVAAVPIAPTIGFCWLGITTELLDPVWQTYHTINPQAVLPAEFPFTSPNFSEVYTEGCVDPTPP